MEQPNLPRHVVERVERRWAAVFSQQATRRLEKMKDPSPEGTKPTPEQGSVQPIPKRPAWNGCF
jgi:hypothetical protein